MKLLLRHLFFGLHLPLVFLLGCGSPPENRVLPLAEWKGGSIDQARFEEIREELKTPSKAPTNPQELQTWRRAIIEQYVIDQEINEWIATGSEPSEGRVFSPSPYETALIKIVRQQSFRLTPISSENIEAYYESHPSEFGHPEQIRLHHIFLRYPLSPSAQDKAVVAARMEALLEELRQGANFEDLARAHSQSETAPKGGLIGNIARGKMAPSLENILWNLKEGETSDLVPTPQGIHLFRVAVKTAKLEVSPEEAGGGIRRKLERQALQQEEERLFNELLQSSGGEFYPNALKKEPSSVLFQLEDRRVTQDDFVRWILEKDFKEQRSPSPQEQLKAAVFNELLLWKAYRENIEEDPKLAPQLQELKSSLQNTATVRQLLNRELDRVPAADIQGFYELNSKRFQSPKLYRMSLLTLPFPHNGNPNETFDALRRLSQSIVHQKTSFAEAARDQSSDISAYRDGDLGWIRLDAFGEWAGPQGKKTVEGLEKGKLSVPFLVEVYDQEKRQNIRTAFALARIEDIKESAPRPLEEVHREVVKQWLQYEGETLDNWFRKSLLKRAQLVVHERS